MAMIIILDMTSVYKVLLETADRRLQSPSELDIHMPTDLNQPIGPWGYPETAFSVSG